MWMRQVVGWLGLGYYLAFGNVQNLHKKEQKPSPLPQEKYGTEQAGNPLEAAGEGSAQDEGERGGVRWQGHTQPPVHSGSRKQAGLAQHQRGNARCRCLQSP